jgi:hypothetical protein
MKSGINVETVVFKRFFLPEENEHCVYSPLINKRQILIANDLYAAKYYLSGQLRHFR